MVFLWWVDYDIWSISLPLSQALLSSVCHVTQYCCCSLSHPHGAIWVGLYIVWKWCISRLCSHFLALCDKISVWEKANRRPHIPSKSFIEIRKRKQHICWFNPFSTIMPDSAYLVSWKKTLLAVFLTKWRDPQLFCCLGIDYWKKKTVPTWNIVQGKTQSSWHLLMSGIYNVGHCVMTCWVWLSKCEQGSSSLFFNRHSTAINLVEAKGVHL